MGKFAQAIMASLLVSVLAFAISVIAPTLSVHGQDSLYERLGGMEAIEAVVGESLNNWVNDERISHYFTSLSQERAQQVGGLLAEQICAATGGPCTYTGLPMVEAHMGMALTDADFDALVEGMSAAMITLGVPEAEQNELVALLAPLRADVVQARPEATEEPMEEPTEEPGDMPTTGGDMGVGSMWPILIAMIMAVVTLGWLDRKGSVSG